MAAFSPGKNVIRDHYHKLSKWIGANQTTLTSLSGLFYQHQFISFSRKIAIQNAGGLTGANMLLDEIQLKLEESDEYLQQVITILKEETALTDIVAKMEDSISMKGTETLNPALKSSNITSKCSKEEEQERQDVLDLTHRNQKQLHDLQLCKKSNPGASHSLPSTNQLKKLSLLENKMIEFPEPLVEEMNQLSGEYDHILTDIQDSLEKKLASEEISKNQLARFVSRCLKKEYHPVSPNVTLDDISFFSTQELSYIDPCKDLLHKLDREYCNMCYDVRIKNFSCHLAEFRKSMAIKNFIDFVIVTMKNEAEIIIQVSDEYSARTVDDVLKLKEKIFSNLDIGIVHVHVHQSISETITMTEDMDEQLLDITSVQASPLGIREVDETDITDQSSNKGLLLNEMSSILKVEKKKNTETFSLEEYMSLESDDQPSRSSVPSTSEAYRCKAGVCVIINNMTFKDIRDVLPEGQKDEDSLRMLFVTLGFEVKIYQNAKAQDMLKIAEHYSKLDHEGVFVLFVLSHGSEPDMIMGTDGQLVEAWKFERYFKPSNCPSLTNIPKIFLFDACRGNKCDKSLTLTIKQHTENPDTTLVFASSQGGEANALTQNFCQEMFQADENDNFHLIMNRIKINMKNQTVTVEGQLTKNYFIKKGTDMLRLQLSCKAVPEAIQAWIEIRYRTIEKIENIIKHLIDIRRNINISRITGSVVSLGGVALVVGGFLLAPFTGGLSVGIGVAGVTVTIAGGATAAGASLADVILQAVNVKKAQEQYDHDQTKLRQISELAQEMQDIIDSTRDKCPDIDNKTYAQFITSTTTQLLVRGGNIAIKTGEVGALALRIGGAAAKTVAVAEIVLNFLLVPIDIAEIIRSSVNISKGNVSDAVKKLHDLKEKLEEQKQTVLEKNKQYPE